MRADSSLSRSKGKPDRGWWCAARRAGRRRRCRARASRRATRSAHPDAVAQSSTHGSEPDGSPAVEVVLNTPLLVARELLERRSDGLRLLQILGREDVDAEKDLQGRGDLLHRRLNLNVVEPRDGLLGVQLLRQPRSAPLPQAGACCACRCLSPPGTAGPPVARAAAR